MHAKTDSEVTSLAPSSPTRSPRRPVYYVQSPSRDSHDGEKTTTSFHSTPVISPMGSPPHSHSSVGRHSRESSSSRFSGSLKPGGSRKISPNDPAAAGGKSRKGHREKQMMPRKEWEVIEEEGWLEDEDDDKGIPRKCYYLMFVLGFFVLFSFFALVLWGASRNQKPQITMKTMTIENLFVQAGTDASGVATDMVTVNSSVKFTFRNTATFFGVHVSSTPLDLQYSMLTLATGNMNYFYQRRKSQRNVDVAVVGNKIPLYGSGSNLQSNAQGGGSAAATTAKKQAVPLTLGFKVRAKAYVLGKLVKPKFYVNVNCSVMLDLAKINKPIPLKNACHLD